MNAKKPNRVIKTSLESLPEFPSYSDCEKTFFRVATVPKKIDGLIVANGWESGWVRRQKEVMALKGSVSPSDFDALPPEAPIEERIIEYVRVKGVPSKFPKNSTIVGVLADPIRTLSVGYHTGFDSGVQGNAMRMDEIEVGACARAPECKKLTAYDSSKVFADKGLEPRYSTEGEHAIDTLIPPACVVATYRIKFQKVDNKCYSENGNCNF